MLGVDHFSRREPIREWEIDNLLWLIRMFRSCTTRKTLSKRVSNWNEIRVVNLVNSEGSWDQEKMEIHCWPYEVAEIEAVKIGGQNQMDRRVWKYEETGQYFVKSGYLAQTSYSTHMKMPHLMTRRSGKL